MRPRISKPCRTTKSEEKRGKNPRWNFYPGSYASQNTQLKNIGIEKGIEEFKRVFFSLIDLPDECRHCPSLEGCKAEKSQRKWENLAVGAAIKKQNESDFEKVRSNFLS